MEKELREGLLKTICAVRNIMKISENHQFLIVYLMDTDKKIIEFMKMIEKNYNFQTEKMEITEEELMKEVNKIHREVK